jgi:hypothetical protein
VLAFELSSIHDARSCGAPSLMGWALGYKEFDSAVTPPTAIRRPCPSAGVATLHVQTRNNARVPLSRILHLARER